MRIDSNGNIGIGGISPQSNGGATAKVVHTHNSAVGNWAIDHWTTGSTGSAGGDGFIAGVIGSDAYLYNYEASNMIFATNSSEAMRIDSSGNLLVGKTSIGLSTTGIDLRSTGLLQAIRNGGTVVELNRQTSDGTIIDFRKDNTTVGSIGTNGGNLYAGSGDVGLAYFNGGTDFIQPFNPSTRAGRDNAIDLGNSGNRFDDIYATNGTIQTSDQNEKQDIAELSDAERRVAVTAKGLLRKFRWKDAVAEKGDEARTHFGIIAQDLQAAFAAEGLDAGDYAMFIHTTWTDEETGEERSRMGVRYSELLAFIIAAI